AGTHLGLIHAKVDARVMAKVDRKGAATGHAEAKFPEPCLVRNAGILQPCQATLHAPPTDHRSIAYRSERSMRWARAAGNGRRCVLMCSEPPWTHRSKTIAPCQ